MSPPSAPQGKRSSLIVLVIRLVLGALFLYVGIKKVIDPVAFLKLVRAYEITDSPLALNLAAALVPWIEIVAGLCLVAGIMIRGAAATLLGMLLAFTGVILWRTLRIYESREIAFCAIEFDCGCGLGEVAICWKLLENAVLCAAAVVLLMKARIARPNASREK